MLETLRNVVMALVAVGVPIAVVWGILYFITGEAGLAYNLALPITCVILWMISNKD